MMRILPIETFLGSYVELEFNNGKKIDGLLSRYKEKYAITKNGETILIKTKKLKPSIKIIEKYTFPFLKDNTINENCDNCINRKECKNGFPKYFKCGYYEKEIK